MNCCFGIIPDGDIVPVALFASLEDAMEWGVHKYGGGKFSIRHVAVAEAGELRAAKAGSTN